MRFPWTRRPAAAAPAPRLEVVQDGAGELGVAGQARYSFNPRPGSPAARLAERLDTVALIRRLDVELEEDK